MRQNFVLKKKEENGKETISMILYFLAVIQVILGFVGAGVTGMSGAIVSGVIAGIVTGIIAVVIDKSANPEYLGYFSMDGFSIECKIVKGKSKIDLVGEVKVNDVLLPKTSSKKEVIDRYGCVINGMHNFEMTINFLSPVATIDGQVVIEDDIVYVDKIKQLLNL